MPVDEAVREMLRRQKIELTKKHAVEAELPAARRPFKVLSTI
jgi:hypothetical protein